MGDPDLKALNPKQFCSTVNYPIALGTRTTWRFMGRNKKWGYKSPNTGCKYSYNPYSAILYLPHEPPSSLVNLRTISAAKHQEGPGWKLQLKNQASDAYFLCPEPRKPLKTLLP